MLYLSHYIYLYFRALIELPCNYKLSFFFFKSKRDLETNSTLIIESLLIGKFAF